jgi:NAD(P)-dependent dehydrogenase (short-subunit alcohol dehydrogenase family)
VSARPSFVVTGAAQGVGRAIAERLAQSGRVVVLDVAAQLDWQHADVGFVSSDAGDPAVARHAAEVAEQAADTVAFLLSEQAGIINGVILPVDGGRAANGPDPEAI